MKQNHDVRSPCQPYPSARNCLVTVNNNANLVPVRAHLLHNNQNNDNWKSRTWRFLLLLPLLNWNAQSNKTTAADITIEKSEQRFDV